MDIDLGAFSNYPVHLKMASLKWYDRSPHIVRQFSCILNKIDESEVVRSILRFFSRFRAASALQGNFEVMPRCVQIATKDKFDGHNQHIWGVVYIGDPCNDAMPIFWSAIAHLFIRTISDKINE